MTFGKYLVPSFFVCTLSAYSTYKYLEMKRSNMMIEEIKSNNKLNDFLYNTHQNMAFHLDKILESYERGTKIAEYRKILANYCEGKILQTCVGTSRNIKYFRPGSTVTFIDWSPNMMEVSLSKSYPFLATRFVIGDVTKMPFEDNEFDTVIDTFGLEYVDEPQKALQEMSRVCKKDGKILMMAQGMPELIEMHSYYNFKAGKHLMNGGFFVNRKWDQIIKESGLQVVGSQRKSNGTIYVYVLKNNKPQLQQSAAVAQS